LETLGKQSNYEEKNIEKLRRRNETNKTHKHINMCSRINYRLNRLISVGNIWKTFDYEEKNIETLRHRHETYKTCKHINVRSRNNTFLNRFILVGNIWKTI